MKHPALSVSLTLVVALVAASPRAARGQETEPPSTARPGSADPTPQPEDAEAGPRPAAAPVPEEESAVEREVATIARELGALRTEFDGMFARLATTEGDERRLLWDRILRRGSELRQRLDAAQALIERADPGRRQELTARLAGYLRWASQLLRDQLEESQRLLEARRLDRSLQSDDDLLIFEQELSRHIATIDDLLRALAGSAERRRALGVDVRGDLAYLDHKLVERAEELGGRALLAVDQSRELADQLDDASPEEARVVVTRQRALRERLHGIASGLSATIALMDARGLDTARYKQLLIQSTGDLTADVLDTEVALGLFESWWQDVVTWVRAEAPRLTFAGLVFLLILLGFRLLAGIARRVTTRALAATSSSVPVLLRNTAASLVSNTVMLVGLLVGLSQLGIEIGPMLASLGVAGFIVGFALQDSLSNFAAGAMILVYQPFDVGDVVQAAGVKGTVRHLSLVSTTLLTFDNQRLIVPNRKIWGDVILNVTAEQIRRVDIEVAVGYGEDVEEALRLLEELATSHEKVLRDPAPTIRVDGLGQSRIDIVVRPWAKSEDYWTVLWDLNRAIPQRLRAEGIRLSVPAHQVAIERGPGPAVPAESIREDRGRG